MVVPSPKEVSRLLVNWGNGESPSDRFLQFGHYEDFGSGTPLGGLSRGTERVGRRAMDLRYAGRPVDIDIMLIENFRRAGEAQLVQQTEM